MAEQPVTRVVVPIEWHSLAVGTTPYAEAPDVLFDLALDALEECQRLNRQDGE